MATSRGGLRLVGLWNHDQRDAECLSKRLSLFRPHRDGVLNVKELAAKRRAIEIEAAAVDELLHRPLRLRVGVTELFDESAHSLWVYYAHSTVKRWAHCTPTVIGNVTL